MTDREREIDELYEHWAGNGLPRSGPVPLGECAPPAEAGIYVFFEPGEVRRNDAPRIVRVGEAGDLRSRLLRMHLRGTHRWSVFRKHVGRALIERGDVRCCPTWGKPVDPVWRRAEADLEEVVTGVMRAMFVSWRPIGAARKDCEEK